MARIKRLAHHLRQIDIAFLARCSPQDVSNFERGRNVNKWARLRISLVLELGDEAEE